MSWVKTDFWLGLPMKGLSVNPLLLERHHGLTVNFFGHPQEYAPLITRLFEKAGIIPDGSSLVGVQHEPGRIDITMVFTHPSFALTFPGERYPIETAVVEKDKWDAALADMNETIERVKEQVDRKVKA